MARLAASHIRDALTSLLPPVRIRALARDLGVVQRRRKLDVVALVYALALGFSVGDQRCDCTTRCSRTTRRGGRTT